MSQIIIHNNGKFNIFGTIMDAPYFLEGCTEVQLENWLQRECGKHGFCNMQLKIKRAKQKGTSSIIDSNLKETILCNRAGENESNINFEDFVNKFLS